MYVNEMGTKCKNKSVVLKTKRFLATGLRQMTFEVTVKICEGNNGKTKDSRKRSGNASETAGNGKSTRFVVLWRTT